MSTLPFIVMTGGLIDIPELRFTPSGKAVINFRLGSKKRIRGADGAWTDGDPIYMNVSAWERLAENAAETLTRKGQRVTVTGRLAQQWWEKDGQKQSKFVIEAETIAADLTFSAYNERESAASGSAAGDSTTWGASSPAADDEPPF